MPQNLNLRQGFLFLREHINLCLKKPLERHTGLAPRQPSAVYPQGAERVYRNVIDLWPEHYLKCIDTLIWTNYYLHPSQFSFSAASKDDQPLRYNKFANHGLSFLTIFFDSESHAKPSMSLRNWRRVEWLLRPLLRSWRIRWVITMMRYQSALSLHLMMMPSVRTKQCLNFVVVLLREMIPCKRRILEQFSPGIV